MSCAFDADATARDATALPWAPPRRGRVVRARRVSRVGVVPFDCKIDVVSTKYCSVCPRVYHYYVS